MIGSIIILALLIGFLLFDKSREKEKKEKEKKQKFENDEMRHLNLDYDHYQLHLFKGANSAFISKKDFFQKKFQKLLSSRRTEECH